MGDIAIHVVRLIHVALVLFMIIVPFQSTPSLYLLIIHVFFGTMMLLHWLMSSDGCILTVIESKLRGIPASASFVHSIVSPIYNISDEVLKPIVSVATVGLVALSVKRLFKIWPRPPLQRTNR